MKGQNYPEDFRKSVVSKFLNRGSKTAESVAQDVDVSLSCIYAWIKRYGNVQAMTNKPERKPNDRKPHEKFQLVMKFFSLCEEERGEFLRQNGLHTNHLEQWKKTMESGFALRPVKSLDLADEKKKNKVLEREIRRKDKALAEAAALLILQKKANLLWGKDEDE